MDEEIMFSFGATVAEIIGGETPLSFRVALFAGLFLVAFSIFGYLIRLFLARRKGSSSTAPPPDLRQSAQPQARLREAEQERITVVVSPVGTATENGQALLDALAAIGDASPTKKYRLYIEPGTYDMGNRSLRMKDHVSIAGARELEGALEWMAARHDGAGYVARTVLGKGRPGEGE